MKDGCQELLLHAKHIHDKYETINKYTGESFNVFKVLNVHYKEVPICRMIHELLSPEGGHGQGTAYLELFMEEVLAIQKNSLADDEWNSIKVEREKVIDNNRRIDLVIKTQSRFIPIEVKIYAEDQEKQCLDYFNYANNVCGKDAPTTLFYLTRFGTLPSEYSTKSDDRLNIKAISFAHHILPWLEKCLQYRETWRLSTVSNTIYQLIDAIKDFTNGKKDLEMEEIAQYLRESKENLQDALRIENAVNAVRRSVLEELFNGVEKAINGSIEGNSLYVKSKETNLPESVTKYRSSRTLPCLAYSYKDKSNNEIEIIVKLQVDYRVYISRSVKCEKGMQESLITKEINSSMEILDSIYPNSDSKNTWRYLENKVSSTSAAFTLDNVPNFIEFNDAFYRLLNEDNLKTYIDYCVKAMLKLLEFKDAEIKADE